MTEQFLLYLVTSLFYLTCFCFAGIGGSCNFLQSPEPRLYKVLGDTFTLKWIFKLDPSLVNRAFLRLTIPGDSGIADIICAIKISDGDSSCIDKTDPPLNSITWTGNISKNIASFLFSNVTRDLALNYSLVFYRCGTESSMVKLEIIDPPRFKESITRNEIVEGQTLTETCTTVAVPPMVVKWINENKKTLSQGNISSILSIPNITRQDSGTYICLGTNEVGVISRNVTVEVVYPPTITLSSSVNKSFIGEKASLKCSADGNPPPTYRWIKPSNSGNHPSLIENGSSILRILFKTSDDFGNYTCIVNNSVGISSRTITVNELFGPGKIDNLMNSTGVHSVYLSWSEPKNNGGSKILNYQIKVNGEEKKDSYNETKRDITNLNKNTTYIFCISARNKVGVGEEICIKTTTLWEGPPERPTQNNPKLLSNNEDVIIKVSWNSVGNDVTYTVKYRPKDTNEWTVKNLTGLTALTYKITGLEQGRTYEIVIIAVNQHGPSLASKSKYIEIPAVKTPKTITTTVSSISTTFFNPGANDEESKGSNKTTIIVISVLLALLVIIAILFFILWMKRRSGREQERDVQHIPGPINQDLYATVENKPKKKEKNKGDLVYAELSEISPALNEHKASSYEPTDYADISHILTANADPVYSNIEPRNDDEGTYANVAEMAV